MKLLKDHGRALRAAAGTVTALACAAVFAGPVAAQETTPPAQEQAVTEVTDAELESFVLAHLEVQQIQNELNAQLQATEDPEQAQAIQQEANQRMLAAIEAQGLTAERFSEIVDTINADPETGQRFAQKVEEVTAAEQGPSQQ